MFKTIVNAWKVAELRRKILFTIMVIIVFRIGSVIPVPFLNIEALQGLMGNLQEGNTLLAYLDTLSGGAFAQAGMGTWFHRTVPEAAAGKRSAAGAFHAL